MKAIQITQTGNADVLILRDVPTPELAPGHALIRIEAIGVNFIDIYIREGRYARPLPIIPGQEAAGTVIAVADDVTTLAPGDRVAWCNAPGAYAEFAAVPVAKLVTIPEAVTTQQAAAALLQGMTAHYLAHDSYAMQPGEDVLVHAGAGGVGLLLTQLAKQRGARVFTTVSTAEKAELSRAAGADIVITYREGDFAAEIRKHTPALHAVYDSVGKTTFDQSLSLLRPRGSMVLYGASSGPVPPFDPIRLMSGSLYLTRPTLGDFIPTREALEARASAILSAVADGSLHIRIGHTYPLAEAAQAHRDLEARKTTGKLLLLP